MLDLAIQVHDIGLIASNGVPSFILCRSPYLNDPTLRLYSSSEMEINEDDGLRNFENGLTTVSSRQNVHHFEK